MLTTTRNIKYRLFIRFALALVVFFTISFGFATGRHNGNDEETEKRVSGWIQKTQLGFIENKGQLADYDGNPVPYVFFRTNIKGMDAYITENGITYAFTRVIRNKNENNNEERVGEGEAKEIEWCRVDLDLVGANIKRENIKAEDVLNQGYFNYYLAHCPEGITNVLTYRMVTIKNVYPGIDWVLYGDNENGLKYDFVVHPGANPQNIRLSYKGAGTLKEIENAKGLLITTPLGEIREGALSSYEQGTSKTVKSKYELNNNEVSFKIGSYNTEQTLVIDPPLIWATYYGDNLPDGPRGITVDNMGNVHVVGYTCSANFPVYNAGGGAYYQAKSKGGYDAFVLKFSASGVRKWATFYGGKQTDTGHDITTDIYGNVYFTGGTGSDDFPTENPGGGVYCQSTNGGPANTWDAFIVKLNNKGVRKWATYYGGSNEDGVQSPSSIASSVGGITVDRWGNLYLIAATKSTDLPLKNLAGAYNQPTFGGGSFDAFIVRFDTSGVRKWATYYGGSGDDGCSGSFAIGHQAINADMCGNIYATSQTSSNNLHTVDPGGGAYYQQNLTGSDNAFILRFDSTGVLEWATYYGGSQKDRGSDIVADVLGNVYVAGYTQSSDFPIYDPGGGAYYQLNAGSDAFILKFDKTGVRKWATCFGGTNSENYFSGGITVDYCGNAYITGGTYSNNFPAYNPGGGSYYQTHAGGGDVYIAQFDSTGALTWATCYGGNDIDWSEEVAVNPQGDLFATGEWAGSSFVSTLNPGGGAYYQGSQVASDEGYILKFYAGNCTIPGPTVYASDDTLICEGSSAVLTANSATAVEYVWIPSAGLNTDTGTRVVASPDVTTTYSVIGYDINCISDTVRIVITVSPNPGADFVFNPPSPVEFPPGRFCVVDYSVGATKWYWNINNSLYTDTNQTFCYTPDKQGLYCVTLRVENDYGCWDTTTKCIRVYESFKITIPNVFTPNGDGVNDEFVIESLGLREFTCIIFNRWGKEVYKWSGTEKEKGWDGNMNGTTQAPDGVYYFIIDAVKLSSEKYTEKGFIQLIR